MCVGVFSAAIATALARAIPAEADDELALAGITALTVKAAAATVPNKAVLAICDPRTRRVVLFETSINNVLSLICLCGLWRKHNLGMRQNLVREVRTGQHPKTMPVITTSVDWPTQFAT
jgi:hypothetical protein